MKEPEPIGHPVFHCKVYSDPQWGHVAVCPFVRAFVGHQDPEAALIRLEHWVIPMVLSKRAWENRN